MVAKLYNKLYELCKLYKVCYIPYIPYIPYVAKGFLRCTVMYLKDHSPYPDSSLFIINLRIQLELIYWVTTPLVVIILLTYCLYLYTQPINKPTVVLATRFYYTFTTKVTVLKYGEKLNNMPPKAPVAMPLTAVTTLGLGDTSIADTDL